MNTFIDDNFLLRYPFAEILYHDYAKNLPIIDYHSHLSPSAIARNEQFQTITKIWLEGDHYKWRAMRTLGIDEKFITGNASDAEKFQKWAETVPYTVRNPLYHWTHLELTRYFNINQLLGPETATRIYLQSNEMLQTDHFRTQALLKKMKAEVICTTDDPTDDLAYHKEVLSNEADIILLPTFRPDKAYAIENGENYIQYIRKLGEVTGKSIDDYNDLLHALSDRIDFFHENRCRLSDHGLERIPDPVQDLRVGPEVIFKKVLALQQVSSGERDNFRYCVLLELSRMYHAKSWTQQFHLGALRNTNSRMMRLLGPDTGFDLA